MGRTKMGDWVKIYCTCRLEDGTVFDSSRDRNPLECTAGDQEVISGMDQAVRGMQPGESKTVVLSAEEAYGPRTPDLEKRFPRDVLPDEVQIGDRIQAKVGEKNTLVWVSELGVKSALIDANHSLAGAALPSTSNWFPPNPRRVDEQDYQDLSGLPS